MDFVLNGRSRSLDAETVRTRVAPVPPDAIRRHWVEIDGRRWPPKQAFRVATGLADEPFVSHFAMRIFQRLGFTTSPIPSDSPTSRDDTPIVDRVPHPLLTYEDALEAFRRLDAFFSTSALTTTLADLESLLVGADQNEAVGVAAASGFDEDLVDSALIVRERVGMLDSLMHAAVITQVLPLILEDDERVLKRPSLGAGNDPDRVYDLETTHRVAEFKLSSWKGRDGMRQRGLFADVVGLSLDDTARRRQVYVVGDLPVRFLTTSGRNAVKTLSKAALRLRAPFGLTDDMTVSEFTEAAGVEVIDLTDYPQAPVTLELLPPTVRQGGTATARPRLPRGDGHARWHLAWRRGRYGCLAPLADLARVRLGHQRGRAGALGLGPNRQLDTG